jgi:hypothetical protein
VVSTIILDSNYLGDTFDNKRGMNYIILDARAFKMKSPQHNTFKPPQGD